MKPWQEKAVVALLVLIFVGLTASSALRKSATVDEFAHLPAGLYAWKTYEAQLYDKSPPTGRMFETADALLLKPQVDPYLKRYPDNSWRPWLYGTEFMRMNLKSYSDILLVSRLSVIALGVMICLIVWSVAKGGYGEYGGLVALAACALSPTMIAHSRLVTTDVAAALFSTVFLIALIKYFDGPSLGRAMTMAAAFALAALSKFSCLFWAPFMMAAPFLSSMTSITDSIDRPSKPKAVLHFVAVLVMAWAVICGGYFGKGVGIHPEAKPASKVMSTLAPAVRYAPLPLDFITGLDRQLHDAEAGEWSQGNFLLGQWYKGGKWYYYLVGVGAKEPLPWLALFAISVILIAFTRDRDELILLFAVASFFITTSLVGSLQIGIRYLLPIYPAAFIITGNIGGWVFAPPAAHPDPGPGREAPKHTVRKILRISTMIFTLIMLAWMAVESALIWPDYLAYFNQAVGGPKNGRNVLLDSNLDWGQDLPGLARWMKDNGAEAVDLAYFGHDDPSRFGIEYMLPGRDSDNRYIAISANLLMGKLYPMTFLTVGVQPDDPLWEELKKYRDREPIASIGHSIFVYDKI